MPESSDNKLLVELEQKLKEQSKLFSELEKRFRTLADTSQEAIILIDSNYVITFANKEAEHLLGYAGAEIVGADFRKFIADEDKKYVEERYKKRQSGEPVEPRYRIKVETKSRAYKTIDISVSLFTDSSGNVETIAHLLDVTAKTKMEKRLEHRLGFEQIIASISTIFINFPPERLNSMVGYALRKIAEFNEFDRGYIYMSSSSQSKMELTHEWCRQAECMGDKGNLELSPEALPWILEKLNRQENILVTNIFELPSDAVYEKHYFENRGVKSFLVVPLIYNQTLTGFMGLESYREEKIWFDEDIRLMNLASETIINAYKRKWSEAALKESEERFRGIYESANIGIYRYNRNHKMEMANPALLSMLGYESFDEFSVVDMKNSVFADFAKRSSFENKLLIKNNVDGYETQWLRRDNTIIEMSESARAVRDERGRFLYFEGFVENISEKKKARELLLEAKETAEKSSQMKSDFIQQMSHEIRTPITAIINNVNMLRFMLGESENNEYEDQFNTIARGGMRIIRTIDMIIDMSEIQSGNYKPDIKQYDLLKDILNEILLNYKKIAEEKNIILESIYDEASFTMNCDLYSAKQIFEQVIDNAVKFTVEGSVNLNITSDAKGYIVTVKDTGVGISEAYLPKIFEPFSQEEEGTNRRFEGNGLGLTLANEYSQINGWGISIESKKNETTEVTITLPVE